MDDFREDVLGQCDKQQALVGWLRPALYSPQPYDELAKFYKDNGEASDSTCILLDSAAIAAGKNPFQRLYGLVAGYGYTPEKVFVWVVVMVAIGMIVLIATRQGKDNHMPIGFFYSLSALIPFVSLDKRFDDIKLSWVARWYFFVHKIIGYVIAIFLAAALTSLSVKQ